MKLEITVSFLWLSLPVHLGSLKRIYYSKLYSLAHTLLSNVFSALEGTNIHILFESTSAAKYLGVTISDDLKWRKHIDNIIKRQTQTLGFLKRNIKVHNQDLKSTAYKTLMRPQLEYASSVWSPHSDQDIYKIESAQRRAARWATSTSSVTEMLRNPGWRPLDQRRIDNRLVMMYKIAYDIVAIPLTEYLIPNRRES